MLEIYGKYKLKDGRYGWIIDVLADGAEYIFELDKKGIEDRIISISSDDVAEKLS